MRSGTGVRLLYGPERLPLERRASDTAERWGYRPFHGIVSLGLARHDACTPERWYDAAHLLDEGGALADEAQACGVRSFDESLSAAIAVGVSLGGTEVWHVKEGHTSSVWRISTDDPALPAAAVNVARDDAAWVDLLAGAHVLATIEREVPHLVAGLVGAPDAHASQRAVVQAWVDGALEVHPVSARGEPCRFHAVERFVTDAHHPARITGIVGHALDDDAHERFGFSMAQVLLASAARAGDVEHEVWVLPRFDVVDGDWVVDGGEPRIVACSGDTARVDDLAAGVAASALRAAGPVAGTARAALERGISRALAA